MPESNESADITQRSLADYVQLAAAHLPDALVSPQSLNDIATLAAPLPGAISSFFGFECPLSTPTGEADFLVCCTRAEGHSRVLAGGDPDTQLPAALRAAPAWQRVEGFCRQWETPDSALAEGILNLWLEFDITSTAQALSLPSVFFGTQAPAPGAPAVDQLPLLRRALEVLAAGQRPAVTDAALTQFFAALPAGAHVFQVGAMWSRPGAGLRLCLRGIDRRQMVDTLLRLGWPGDPAPLQALLDELSAFAGHFDLNVDLGESLGPKVGIECYFPTDGGQQDGLQRAGDYLVNKGLCTPEKAQGLVRYCGFSLQGNHAGVWPAELSALASAAGGGALSSFHRFVHHLKIVYQAGLGLSAKAYLGMEHQLLDRQAVRQLIAAAKARKSADANPAQ